MPVVINNDHDDYTNDKSINNNNNNNNNNKDEKNLALLGFAIAMQQTKNNKILFCKPLLKKLDDEAPKKVRVQTL